jgi:beta-phosphoglucomutase-like phosphatase (HAD superfamily)
VSQRHTPSTRRRTDLPALLFDLDGTLIDSVYEHVTSWADALKSAGIVIPQWKIHRRVGMSGKAFLQELAELEGAGAFRVYSDPADLLLHIEQLGLPGEAN